MMKLLFERSRSNRGESLIPPCDCTPYVFSDEQLRKDRPNLPEIAEVDLSRHYTELMKQVHGVNDGFYPLGSCTMKYNPKINEVTASLNGFTDVHPLQPSCSVQGSLEVLYKARTLLCEITGMDEMTFQPAAGAHGEYTGLLLIRKYHQMRGDSGRVNIIVPDSAHGTNPASASMAGFKVINVPSNEKGGVDIEALKNAVGEDTAG
ncbi:MAG: aminomethyl-transferring glycine dehydrogenase subunit GcvPB, partial [Erysipelotrichaceae bacterium]|nr:aminomethyl-transferring glycine dehydrogenase subunit GcvPB [Erysipelotrichaceae bacterium]